MYDRIEAVRTFDTATAPGRKFTIGGGEPRTIVAIDTATMFYGISWTNPNGTISRCQLSDFFQGIKDGSLILL